MRTGWIAALIVIILGLTSCTTSGTSIGTSATGDPKAEPPVRSILLTAGDLPSGWAVDTGQNGNESGSFLPGGCWIGTPLEKVDPGAYASVSFSQPASTGTELYEEVAFSKSAKAAFASVEKTLNDCRAFSTGLPEEGTGNTFSIGSPPQGTRTITGTIRPASFPRYATSQAGFLISLSPVGSVVGQLGFVIVQKGKYLVYLGYVPSTSTFNPHQLEPFIPVALARVPSA